MSNKIDRLTEEAERKKQEIDLSKLTIEKEKKVI